MHLIGSAFYKCLFNIFLCSKRKKYILFDKCDVGSSQLIYELSLHESFMIQYSVNITDQNIGSLERIFEQQKQYEDIFGILFITEKLMSLNTRFE